MSDKVYEFSGYPIWITKDWEKWIDLASSFRGATDVLLQEQTKDKSGFSERDIFPILLLAKHFLELTFKGLLVKEGAKLETHHDLSLLLSKVKMKHPALKLSEASEKFIKELYELDKRGDALKYPVDKKNVEFFHFKPIGSINIWLSRLHSLIYDICQELNDYLKKFNAQI